MNARAWTAVLVLAASGCATTSAAEAASPPGGAPAEAAPGGAARVDVAPECPKELGAAGADGSKVLGAKVEKVCLVGASESAYLRLHEVVAPREGTTLEASAVRGDLEALFAEGMVKDATALAIPFGDGKRVVLAYFVTEAPFVSKVSFEGLSGMRPDDLREAAPSGRRASALELKKMQNAVAERYAEAGYLKAQVSVVARPMEGGTTEAAVVVSEGKRTVLEKIRFVGNKRVSEKELKPLIKSQAGLPYQELLAETDAFLLQEIYYDRGMVNVRIAQELIDGSTELTFTITEGDVFKVGVLSLKGFSLGDEKDVMKNFESKKGGVFSRAALKRDIDRLSDKAAKKGLKINVTPITNVDSDKKIIDVAFEVEKKAGAIVF